MTSDHSDSSIDLGPCILDRRRKQVRKIKKIGDCVIGQDTSESTLCLNINKSVGINLSIASIHIQQPQVPVNII